MEYKCGDTGPAGGIVYYASSTPFSLYGGFSFVCSDNCHYLEAQPADLPYALAWCVGKAQTNKLWVFDSPNQTGLGTGLMNTWVMATGMYKNSSKNCTSGAANSAIESRFGGYDDWFLPSRDELGFLNSMSGVVGGFDKPEAFSYWSSSQWDADKAYCGDFVNPDWSNVGFSRKKSSNFLVRPVRAF